MRNHRQGYSETSLSYIAGGQKLVQSFGKVGWQYIKSHYYVHIVWNKNFTFGNVSYENDPEKASNTKVFIITLFMINKNWNELKHLTPGKYLGSLRYGCTRDHYVTLKNYCNKDYTVIWRNRYDIHPSERQDKNLVPY